MKLTKRILSVILTVLLVCQTVVVAFALLDPYRPTTYYKFDRKIENDEFIYWINEEEKVAQIVRVKNQDYTGKDLVIPKEIDGYKIVDIFSYFDADLCNENGYIDTVTSIIIEAELTEAISRDYYYGYNASIAEGPVSDGLFEHFVNLKSIRLPDSLRIIHEGMFKNCKKLEQVELPESLEYIGSDAFENCESLKDIVFKTNLKKIGSYAFKNCNSLTNVVFNDKLEAVYGAFRNCKNLTNVVLNANLKELGSSTFMGCEKLISVDSNDDLKIELSDNLEIIGGNIFSGCTSLKGKIYLGEKVRLIDSCAFAYCPGITGFRVAEGNEHFYQKSGVLYNKDQTKIICYLAGKETPKWTIPASVKYISPNAFENAENLKKITFTSKIVEIPSYAFAGSGIESFSAPKNLKQIGKNAFANCKNLKKVKFNSKLETIHNNAFSGCTKLEGKIEIGKNVDYIGSMAFLYCDNLTGFRIADGNKRFSQKSGVLYNKDKTELIIYLPRKGTEKFKVPSTVKLIDSYAFAGSKYLKEITLPSKLKEIPSHAFYKSNIRSITIPGSVRRLYDYCFANSKISSVKFETGKKNLVIRKYAFLNCDKLKSITLPERVVYVYEQTFYDCDNLTKIKVMNPNCSFSRIYSGDDWDIGDKSRLNEDLVVYGKKKSETERWAKEINRPFKEI